MCVVFTINNIASKYFDEKFVINKASVSTIIFDSAHIDSKKIEKNIDPENSKLIVAFSIAILFFFLFSFATKIYLLVFFIIFVLAYFGACKLCPFNNLQLSIVTPILVIIVSRLFANTYVAVFKDNVSKKIENVLSKYLSRDIKNKILKDNHEASLGGKRAEISVMFADIRGFTSLSETRKPDEVSSLLNEYFTALEPIIAKYNGVINKFIGDAVLVVFGDPVADKNHAKNAIKCAYEMKDKVKEIRESWFKQGKPKIDIGIGINTGDAFIGNIGSSNRFEYTVIGDTVNIASRIEDYNKIYKTNILISQNTYNKISQFVDVIKISEVPIKGKRKKINIYEVLRITE